MPFEDGIKTVSGAICNIQDGAPKVGLESWLVTFPASLSGYSEVNAVRSGKNLYDIDGALYNVDFYDASGNVVQYADCAVSWIKVNPSTQYSFSCTKETSQTVNVRIAWCKSDKSFISRQGLFSDNQFPMTLTTPSNCEWAQLSVNQYGTSLIAQNNWSIQVEQSNTASTFEEYTGTQYTASLGRTIYGGTADIVNGQGSDNCTRIQIKDRTWTITEVGSSFQVFTCNKITNKATNFNFQVEGYENAETYRNYLQDKQCGTYNTTNAMDRIVIRDDSYTTVEDFLTAKGDNYIVYENTSPTPFTFTPIPTPETPLGVSNWWSVGTSEISYHDNAHGFASVTVTKQAPDQADEVKTAYLHKVIFGGLVDVISGKAEPKNLIPFEPISEYTYLGITYTQYSDGTVKINGTASGGLSFYRVIPNGSDGVHFKSGVAYTLSGCVGGSSTTYQLDLRVGNSVVGYYKNAIDYGRGYTFTATEDSVAYPLICVRNGTTVNNVIISPMVEVGSSASEYAPHFDPFTFPPISMETDEGENTLYADEGDSAIVYRKEST